MKNIYIRKLEKDDWKLFRAMRIEMVTHNPECFLESADQAKSRPDERWISELSNPKNALFMLYNKELPVGFAGNFHFGEMKDHEREIGMLYVNPRYRGNNFALQLVNFCLDYALADKSISHMGIGHRRNNNASKSVILRCGFIPIGEIEYIFGNGEKDISLKYEKIIR
ncbi:MAG TPA: GNAT family N-acetyltransferase [Alphaproteobacteria bacterium]|nr:GNAT family N-acetyltransferase [Alphaproteobacteria bacterium]HNS43927.1 GNAT family N-acetyltransferase [Alphaproteobacteria bacterium]